MSHLVVGEHIAVADDWHSEVVGGLLHQAPVCRPFVSLLHGAAVNGDSCRSCILQRLSHLHCASPLTGCAGLHMVVSAQPCWGQPCMSRHIKVLKGSMVDPESHTYATSAQPE